MALQGCLFTGGQGGGRGDGQLDILLLITFAEIFKHYREPDIFWPLYQKITFCAPEMNIDDFRKIDYSIPTRRELIEKRMLHRKEKKLQYF